MTFLLLDLVIASNRRRNSSNTSII
jgi:hypothetical protein